MIDLVIDPHDVEYAWRVRGGRLESCYKGTWVFDREFAPTPERVRMWAKLLIRAVSLSETTNAADSSGGAA